MASSKPTIILIPGAWHTPDGFVALSKFLESAGYHTIPVSLPSVGASPPLDDFQPDVAAIRDVVTSCVDAGQDVILFMHSYASLPGCEAIKGLTKSDREREGKAGGVKHLIFCSAFVLPEGVSPLDTRNGEPWPWFVLSDDSKIVTPAPGIPEQLFYNDLPPDTVSKLVEELKPQSYCIFSSSITYAAYREVPSTYFYNERDATILLEGQKAMVAGSGVKFGEETFDAGHCGFIGKPEEVALAVRRVAGEQV
ncbi:hypothetical protein FS837_003263 [Tulasnella sp. UAMH 9824]|nr:hypothetical protein FS837_003263 [Tulasnella sp. UAMH 9824]